MEVLLLRGYFYPEQCAGIHLTNDLLESFSNHDIGSVVYTPIPCRGIDKAIRKSYKKKKKEIIYNGKVKVYRYWLPYERKNIISRALRYFFQNIIQFFKGLSCKNIDVILLSSTPPTNGIVGGLLKKIKKVPLVYNLQDIFPDSLVTTGLTKKGSLFWKIGRKIENYTYRNADKIIVISETFKKNLLEKNVPEDKIIVVPNWVDVENIKPISREGNKLIEEYNLDSNNFMVVYAGNFGSAQGANVVLQSADLLKEEKDIKFVIFGGGAEFEKAKEQAKTMDNVIINPLLPANRVSEVYSLGDVSLVTCKKGVGNSGMPSKTWSIMACNTPIIASFDTDSELADIIKKAHAGVCVEPEDAKALADAILEAKNKKLTSQGREYVLKYASKDVCAKEYVNQMEKLINI